MAHQGENPQDQRIHRRLGGKLFQRFIRDLKWLMLHGGKDFVHLQAIIR